MAKMVTMGRYALTARWGPELRACRSVELSYQAVSSGVFQGMQEDVGGTHDGEETSGQRQIPPVGEDRGAVSGATRGERGGSAGDGRRPWIRRAPWVSRLSWLQRPSWLRRPPCIPRDWVILGTVLGTILGSLCLPAGGRRAPCCSLCRTGSTRFSPAPTGLLVLL